MKKPVMMERKKDYSNEPFFCDGVDYVIEKHPKNPETYIAFRNISKGRYGVCLREEVMWHTHLNKWVLMGRLLTIGEKNNFMLKPVEMPWGHSLPGWGPRAEDHEIIREMIKKKEI